VGKRENEREGEGLGKLGEEGRGRLGRPGRPTAREREKREREKEKEKERKGFSPFRNPIFLDECTYISKQSKNA
jgi:hypothetical protein